ncbi:MAG TPA: MFS transporter [Candidatus Acidoferrales bacterium]|nr:MFS transporter [Candidatus Acidoferrales bacterium]
MPNPWPDCPKLPPGAAAVLAALHLGEPRLDLLASLEERGWGEALDFADRSQLTLVLRGVTLHGVALPGEARAAMPEAVGERLDRNAKDNLERLRRTEELYRAIAERFGAAGIPFLALKGLTQCQWVGVPPETRAQYDIDILTPREALDAARDVLLALGFEPIEDMEKFPTDHLPAMVRKTGWEWRGNIFDPEMPLTVEPHFRFWNPGTERLRAPGVEEFWSRRLTSQIAGTALGVLHPADALGYSALHLLRHILQGSARPFHVYELARFLDARAGDDAFWEEWRGLHAPEMRRLEAVGFQFASAWFGCLAGPVAQEEMDRLPASTRAWFEDFALAPVSGLFTPSKAELWLHISLLNRPADIFSVARRRLLPLNLPGPVDAIHIPASQMTWRRRMLKGKRRAAFIASRLRHHTAALWPTAASGARWWWRTNGLGPQFWIFLVAAVVFNFGMVIFALLYNLFLTDLGYKEDFLGVVNGASRVGGVVGTIPAAFLAYRYGLRRCLLAAIVTLGALEVGRAAVGARLPLAALAFLSGGVFSLWAVILGPIVAGTVDEKRRPAAFSFFFACMFATGMAGNWVGGWLPLWMHGKRPVLLLSAAMTAVGVLPALRLKTGALPSLGARIYPRSRFLWRFLIPFAVWHLATGSFNPFNNVYFARLGFTVPQIGSIFSGSQLVQVAAVLLAPLVIRRAGLVAGIVWMMAATAFALGGLATPTPGAAAGTVAILAYFAYMAFQWMSEPGLNSLLMNHVDERERSGASAITFLVAFGAQAVAAFAAGKLLVQFGYGPVLAGAAVLAGVAALLFGRL